MTIVTDWFWKWSAERRENRLNEAVKEIESVHPEFRSALYEDIENIRKESRRRAEAEVTARKEREDSKDKKQGEEIIQNNEIDELYKKLLADSAEANKTRFFTPDPSLCDEGNEELAKLWFMGATPVFCSSYGCVLEFKNGGHSGWMADTLENRKALCDAHDKVMGKYGNKL